MSLRGGRLLFENGQFRQERFPALGGQWTSAGSLPRGGEMVGEGDQSPVLG